jgi:DNA-binding XRE family transcriptional regulator
MTQAQLAKAVNEKTSTIVEIENGTGKYVPDTINRIGKVLGVKIPRGRAKKNNKKK